MTNKPSKVELSDKELAIIWAILSWFQVRPLVTSALMSKLYTANNHDIAKKYDDKIYDRIIDIGKWLEKKRNAGEL